MFHAGPVPRQTWGVPVEVDVAGLPVAEEGIRGDVPAGTFLSRDAISPVSTLIAIDITALQPNFQEIASDAGDGLSLWPNARIEFEVRVLLK